MKTSDKRLIGFILMPSRRYEQELWTGVYHCILFALLLPHCRRTNGNEFAKRRERCAMIETGRPSAFRWLEGHSSEDNIMMMLKYNSRPLLLSTEQ